MTILKYQTHDDSLFPQTSLVKFVLVWSCASCSGHTALTIFSIRLGSFDSFHSHYIKDNAYFGTFDIEMKISIRNDLYKSHSQMLGKVESGLPAKI